MKRRRALQQLAAGGSLAILGGVYALASRAAAATAEAQVRPDGRQRLPPGQKLLSQLKPMGGRPGSSLRSSFRLKVHGEVERPFECSFEELLALGTVRRRVDVHCVTGWSVFGAALEGVALTTLAERAKLRPSARHVIFEAAHGYTANVPVREALRPGVMLAHQLDGVALPKRHGAPVRAIVPDLYFWKSAKWITGVRFVRKDEPGYWERRGYNNHADPWREERYA